MKPVFKNRKKALWAGWFRTMGILLSIAAFSFLFAGAGIAGPPLPLPPHPPLPPVHPPVLVPPLPPGPPVVIAPGPPPYPGWVWVPGYSRGHHRYAGHWARPRGHRPRYDRRPRYDHGPRHPPDPRYPDGRWR
jgi:hypothetical protein